MKYLYLFLFLSIYSLEFKAQSEVDSLWGVWNNEEINDTSRYLAAEAVIWKRYARQPNRDSAVFHAKRLVKFTQEQMSSRFVAGSSYILAHMYQKADLLDSCVRYFDLTKINYERAGDIDKMVDRGMKFKGIAYQRFGKFDKSLDVYREILEVGKKYNDTAIICIGYIKIGDNYALSSSHESAIEQFEKGIELARKSNADEILMELYDHQGFSLFEMGSYEKAYTSFDMALEKATDLKQYGQVAKIYNNLGNLTWGIGDNPGAMSFYRKALAINREIDSDLQIAVNYVNIGGIHNYYGNLDSAEYYLTESLRGFENYNIVQGIVECYKKFGVMYYKKGNYDKAEEFSLKGLEKARYSRDVQRESFILEYLAKIELAKGIEAEKNGNDELKRQSYKEAVNYSNLAIKISQRTNAFFEERKALHTLSRIYLVTDSLERAEKVMRLVLENREKDIRNNLMVFSEREKERYFSTMQKDYDLFYDYALIHDEQQHNLNQKSFNNALMIKGLLLKSSSHMRMTILNGGDSTLIETYYDWIAMKRKINKAYAEGGETKELEQKAEVMEKELVKSSGEFQNLQKVQDLSWIDIQKKLKKGESAIEFIRFTHQEDYRDDKTKEIIYSALLVTPDLKYPKMIRLFAEKDLESILGSFPGNNLSYIQQIYGSKENTKTQLYDLIWKPMEESLEGIDKVYFSPVGLLHKVSFAALAKETDVYLCDLYELEVKSSTGKIAFSDKISFSKDAELTLFGGVDYNSDSTTQEIWSYLQGSLNEVEKIKEIVDDREVNYYTAKTASEENFKEMAPKSNILHIATHGFFYPDPNEVKTEVEVLEMEDDLAFRGGGEGFGVESFVKNKNPLMRSGLALAGANDVWTSTLSEGEDGVLTAAEVATVDMRNTDLVVLSACETGLGDIKGSEGVYGLQRSFKMAGADYLIMSLWQVPDKETAEFMTAFYKNLIKSSNIKKSFNHAQKAMRKKYDPYFWASFVLVE